MKKKTKNILFTITVLCIFFVSTFAYAVFYNENNQPNTNNQNDTLPSERVFAAEIDTLTKTRFLQSGHSIATIKYDDICCNETVSYLENMVKQVSQRQLVVEKLANDSIEVSYLIMESAYRKETLNITLVTNQTQTDLEKSIFAALCKVLIEPPVDCGLIVS